MNAITTLRLAITAHNVRKVVAPQPPSDNFNLLLTQDGAVIITQNGEYIQTQGVS